MKKLFAAISILTLIYACTCKCDSQLKNVNIDKVAFQKYGDNYNLIHNDDKSFAIVVEKKKLSPNDPRSLINFFLFSIADKKIVYEKENFTGMVKWKNVHQIEMITIPGIVQHDEPASNHTLIYDLRLRKEISK